MPRFRTVFLVLLLFLLAGLWTACGARPSAFESAPSAPAEGSAAPALMEEPVSVSADAAGPVANLAAPDTRKVIANANMDLVVADTQEAVDAIEALVQELGGYIANANLYKASYSGQEMLQGTITLRIPADRLEEALKRLADLAVDVRSENIDRQDVTDQYSDIEAQLRNLQATENELRELLAEVRARPNATPEDILAVHRSLTEIRGQIEQLQGRKNLLDNQIAFSTVTVTLIPDAANRPVVEEGWRPAVVARDALRALVNTMEFLGNVAIWLSIYVLPLAIVALILLGIVFLVLRSLVRLLQRRAPRRSAASAPAAED